MDIRRTTLVGVTLVLTALLAACATATQDPPPAQSAVLQDTEWVLVSLNGSALVEGKQITLSFGEASLGGSGGCNTYGGSYTASEDGLRLSNVYWTEMACMEPEGIMEQEQAYFQALNAAARYRVDGDRLEVYDEAGTQILAFVTSTSEALAEEEMPMRATPRLSLGCTLEMDETIQLVSL
jgi:heat shock protein HslJ